MHTIAVVSIMFAALLLCTNGADAAPWCTASAGPIAVSIRLSNARLRVRGTADFARRIHSRIRIGPESTREGAIDATIRKSCFRTSPGINVAFPDLVHRFHETNHMRRIQFC